MRRITSIAVLLMLATMSVPSATSHAAPAAPDYMTRILHDHNDDSVFLVGKHGFDSIALDARETYSPIFGEDMLVLRLTLNGGCREGGQTDCETLSEVVKFKANGTEHSLAFVTADEGTTWSGDMDLYGEPIDLNDGTRFAIEGQVRFSRLGIMAGDDITEWFVEGKADGEPADNMPAGIDNQKSTTDATGPLATAYDIGTYTTRAPDYYAGLAPDVESLDLAAGQSATFNLTVENVAGEPQTITVAAFQITGTTIRFTDPETSTQSVVFQADMDTDASVTLTVNLTNMVMTDVSQDLRIIAITSLGGFTQALVPLTLEGSPPIQSGTTTSNDLAKGESYRLKFDKEGTFSYHNHHNALVDGLVVVKAASGQTKEHTISYTAADNEHGAAFDPMSLEIHVGDTVTWTNDHDDMLQIMGSMGGHDHHDHGGHEHDHDDDEPTEEAPGLPALLALLVIAGIALIRRKE